MSPRILIRDSFVLLTIGGSAVLVWAGLSWAVPFALSGLLAIANLFLITLLTRKFLRPLGPDGEGGGATRAVVGMFIKFAGTGAALVALVSSFELEPVLMGFGVVVATISARGVLDLFLPNEAQEA
jgi:hypothetical protein